MARLAALRARVIALHGRVQAAGAEVAKLERAQLSDALDAGDALREVKAALGHGNWMPWCRRELRGINQRTISRYMLLAAHRDEIGQMSNLTEALDAIAAAQLAAKRKALTEHPPALPPGKFSVIVADPPWPIDDRGTRLPYNTMTLDEIRDLPVAQRAADDAALWLWCVDAFLPDAFTVMDGWGFQYARRVAVWCKPNLAPHPWMQGGHELLLIGTRGSPTILPAGHSTVLHGPRREHSRKPDELFELVEAMCPARPEHRLELFAREARPGWSGWGDQLAVPSQGGPLVPDVAAAQPA